MFAGRTVTQLGHASKRGIADRAVDRGLEASAYLGRYTGICRTCTESDLRLFFAWCADQHLTPLTV